MHLLSNIVCRINRAESKPIENRTTFSLGVYIPIPYNAMYIAAAMLGHEIFVAGGQTEKEVINMAEIYNPQFNQWEAITARMSTPRVGLCMVSMANKIYVMGKLHYKTT